MSEMLSKTTDREPIIKRIMDSRIVQFVLNTEQRPMLEVHIPSDEGSVTSVLAPVDASFEIVEARRDELINYMTDQV